MSILFAPVNLSIVRGTRWDDDITLVNATTSAAIDLTGIVGMTMRVREDNASALLLELSTDAGTLVVVTPASGVFGVRASSALTRTLPENAHELAAYVFDIVIERLTGEYEAAAGGVLLVYPQVTRPWDNE